MGDEHQRGARGRVRPGGELRRHQRQQRALRGAAVSGRGRHPHLQGGARRQRPGDRHRAAQRRRRDGRRRRGHQCAADLHDHRPSVNDAPSFTAGANQTVPEDAGLRTVPAWATNISAGPADESGQALGLHGDQQQHRALPAQPSVAPNGTLTFQSAPNANGQAIVTVVLKDNGGTAGGGVDASAPKTFIITVTPVNDAPVLAAIGSRTVVFGNLLTFTAAATDVDRPAQTLTFSLTGAVPDFAFIDRRTGCFFWLPWFTQVGHIYTFNVRVTDSQGAFDEETLTIAVAYSWSGFLSPKTAQPIAPARWCPSRSG